MPKSKVSVLSLLLIIAVAISHGYSRGSGEIGGSGVASIERFPARGLVDISTGSSSITVRSGRVDEIVVRVESTYPTENFSPRYELTISSIILSEDFTDGITRGRASWEITVPEGTSIIANTGSGVVNLVGVNGKITIHSGSGRIEVSDNRGRIDAYNGSGRVEIDGSFGEIDAKTGSGAIVMRNTGGTTIAATGSGITDIDGFEGSISLSSGSGRIALQNAAIDGKSSFSSGSGRIEVELARTPRVDITLSTGSSTAILNYRGNDLEGEFVFVARRNSGRISSPVRFDEESTFTRDNRTYDIKSFATGRTGWQIKIETGSGKAELLDR